MEVEDRSILLPEAFVKGKVGENKVRLDLYRLPEDEYLMLHDVFLENGDKTTQIDHLIFSKYGIFVIETKNYSGYITGESKDYSWIRYVRGKRMQFHNPVRQNYSHVMFLKDLLGLPEKVFIPLVCIYGKCKLEVDWDKSVKLKYLVDRIGFFKDIKLKNYKEIYEKVKELNITNLDERKEIVDYIKKQVVYKEQEEKIRCPKCGGKLVRRKSRYGYFIGCSNYPRCKYIIKRHIK